MDLVEEEPTGEGLPEDVSFFMGFTGATILFGLLACLCCCCLPWPPLMAGILRFDQVSKSANNNHSGFTTTSMTYNRGSNKNMYNAILLGCISCCGGCFPLCCCIGLGCSMLATFAATMTVIEQYDYYGPMRITGFGWSEYGDSQKDSATGLYPRYFEPELVVAYGYDWGCGGGDDNVDDGQKEISCRNVYLTADDTGCATVICSTPEMFGSCSQAEEKAAESLVMTCLAKTYWQVDNISTADELTRLADSFYFDPTVAPPLVWNSSSISFGNDTDNNGEPPVKYLYGNCDKCSVRTSIPSYEEALNTKQVGGVCWIIGLVLLCCGLLGHACFRPFKDREPPAAPAVKGVLTIPQEAEISYAGEKEPQATLVSTTTTGPITYHTA